MFALEQLTAAYDAARNDPHSSGIHETIGRIVGLPSRLYFANRSPTGRRRADLPQRET